MYADKIKEKEATKERVRRYREKQKGVTKEGISGEGVTVPAIVKALTDPKKRKMLEFVSQDLKRKGLGDLVRYGVYGPDFTVIDKLLEATR